MTFADPHLLGILTAICTSGAALFSSCLNGLRSKRNHEEAQIQIIQIRMMLNSRLDEYLKAMAAAAVLSASADDRITNDAVERVEKIVSVVKQGMPQVAGK